MHLQQAAKAPGSPWPSPVLISLLCLFIRRPLFFLSTCHWDYGRTFHITPFTRCCAEQQHAVPPQASSSKKGIHLAEFASWGKCSLRIPGEKHASLSLNPWHHSSLTVLRWCPNTNTNTLLFPRWQFPMGFGFFLLLVFPWQNLRHSDLLQHSCHPMNSSLVECHWNSHRIFPLRMFLFHNTGALLALVFRSFNLKISWTEQIQQLS